MNKGIFSSIVILFSFARFGLAEAPTSDQAAALPSTTFEPAPVAQADAAPTTPEAFAECTPPTRLWFSADYLMWWLRSCPEPVPFLTTFPAGSASTPPGAIGQPDTQVVLGGSDLDGRLRSGGRFTFGGWINCDRTLGLEANYLFIANQGGTQSVNTGTDPTAPIFIPPFFNPITGKEDAGPLTGGGPFNSPGATTYGATLSHTNHLGGAELNGVYNLVSQDNLRVNLLGGFRWLQFNENLGLAQNVTGIPGTIAEGFAYNALDLFDTRNNFYGGQLGARAEWSRGRLFVNASAKVALGTNYESVIINGATQTNFFSGIGGPIQTLPGGIFTQPSNIGVHNAQRFAVVPEGTLNIGYQLRERARVFVGYTFLYVSDVARPGNQIDRTINPSQTNFANVAGSTPIGPAGPLFTLHQTDFWAQGINFGIEFRY